MLRKGKPTNHTPHPYPPPFAPLRAHHPPRSALKRHHVPHPPTQPNPQFNPARTPTHPPQTHHPKSHHVPTQRSAPHTHPKPPPKTTPQPTPRDPPGRQPRGPGQLPDDATTRPPTSSHSQRQSPRYAPASPDREGTARHRPTKNPPENAHKALTRHQPTRGPKEALTASTARRTPHSPNQRPPQATMGGHGRPSTSPSTSRTARHHPNPPKSHPVPRTSGTSHALSRPLRSMSRGPANRGARCTSWHPHTSWAPRFSAAEGGLTRVLGSLFDERSHHPRPGDTHRARGRRQAPARQVTPQPHGQHHDRHDHLPRLRRQRRIRPRTRPRPMRNVPSPRRDPAITRSVRRLSSRRAGGGRSTRESRCSSSKVTRPLRGNHSGAGFSAVEPEHGAG